MDNNENCRINTTICIFSKSSSPHNHYYIKIIPTKFFDSFAPFRLFRCKKKPPQLTSTTSNHNNLQRRDISRLHIITTHNNLYYSLHHHPPQQICGKCCIRCISPTLDVDIYSGHLFPTNFFDSFVPFRIFRCKKCNAVK